VIYIEFYYLSKNIFQISQIFIKFYLQGKQLFTNTPICYAAAIVQRNTLITGGLNTIQIQDTLSQPS
jgi:hypothetical protein